ncbi:unnamed protein product [Medioppia subpectinata]|uniref:Uncharacterized protein n=1 Tax=Medioppia subpectinata TaxID=1979941 RepID=A0A7R9L3E8_9ACAR|nr:unnamed protein product [Medioppia subpectinata]CAG2114841.1 unnamed protein product [Medioppia subpectinata]
MKTYVNCMPFGNDLPEVVAIELYNGDNFMELVAVDGTGRAYYVAREVYVKNLELLFNLPFQSISSQNSDPSLQRVRITKEKTPENTRLITDANDKPVAYVKVQF